MRLFHMAEFRDHPELGPRLIGYDPYTDLKQDHLARFVDKVVDKYACVEDKEPGPGQPAYHPRVLLKVLIYSYAVGVFSSRRMEQNCLESLPYLLLARDDHPSYHVLATARITLAEELHWIWYCLFLVAKESGVRFVGKISVDSTKFKADVSKDSVVRSEQYAELAERLKEILAKSAEVDAREDEEGASVQNGTGVPARNIQMRDIVRSVGKPLDPKMPPPTPRMRKRIESALTTLEMAEANELKHVSLTDPDARMMPIGSRKTIGSGHSLEVSAECGLLMHAQVLHESSDTGRLPAAVEQAKQNAPEGVKTAVADSAFFKREDILALQEAGIDPIVPDSNTACDMKRNQPVGTTSGSRDNFEYLDDQDAYRCPEGNLLRLNTTQIVKGRETKFYKAERSCRECPLAKTCLHNKNAKHRTLKIGAKDAEIKEYLARFNEPEILKIYHSRGPDVETSFAYMKEVMGFDQWHVRGTENVSAEADLLKTAYQLRKLHIRMGRAA